MGYSIAIRARSERLRQAMLSFMKVNYRSWWRIALGEDIPDRQCASEPTTDLSYDRAKNALGFDYQSGLHGWEREHIYAVCRWTALKVGRCRRRFSADEVQPNVFPKPVPFIVYDGHQIWPILVVADLKAVLDLPEGCQWCTCDRLGVRMNPDKYVESIWVDCEVPAARMAEYEAAMAALEKKPGARGHEARMAMRFSFVESQILEKEALIRSDLARLEGLWVPPCED